MLYIYIRVVRRLDKARNMLRNAVLNDGSERDPSSIINHTRVCEAAASESLHLFEEGMSDDLNAPRASAGLFCLVKAAEKVKELLYINSCLSIHFYSLIFQTPHWLELFADFIYFTIKCIAC